MSQKNSLLNYVCFCRTRNLHLVSNGYIPEILLLSKGKSRLFFFKYFDLMDVPADPDISLQMHITSKKQLFFLERFRTSKRRQLRIMVYPAFPGQNLLQWLEEYID
ncbi:Hypothetical predicted protein [Olea europaea subsp. europaea]|uniref:Uncharacterized protein n=1 Tax=Olea europaea subsp. europaea TaxID=158383 RepID=A0A8S0PGF3_OLEEU|nr:Hypothetical predicted protein [Olea europaea subsp. europaea]